MKIEKRTESREEKEGGKHELGGGGGGEATAGPQQIKNKIKIIQ